MSSATTEQEASQQTNEQTEPVPTFVANPAKHAFVTWVIAGDKYVSGALVLGHSIKSQGSNASLVVLVSSDVSEEGRKALGQVYHDVIEVPVINVKVPKKSKGDAKLDAKLSFIRFAFTKLHALTLTKYQKVAVLDADQLCVTNPDSIFEVATPAGICTGVKNETTGHNVLVPLKVFDKAYRDSGILGTTYVLKPSMNDFERALKLLTVKVKVTQVQVVKKNTMSVFKQTKSLFSLLDEDGDDEDEDNEDEDAEGNDEDAGAAAEVEDDAPEQRVVTKTLTPEEIQASMFEEDLQQLKKEKFPFTVYEADYAPLGFQYGEGKKSNMGTDELFIADLYKSQWKHLHSKYGFLSWKKSKGFDPVFLHFTEQPWSRKKEWDDFIVWDLAALDLIDTYPSIKSYIEEQVPILVDKREAKERGELVVKVAEPEPVATVSPTSTTTTTTTTTTDTTTTDTTTTTEETEPVKEVKSVPAPIPQQKAWVGQKPAALQPKNKANVNSTPATPATPVDSKDFPEFSGAQQQKKKQRK